MAWPRWEECSLFSFSSVSFSVCFSDFFFHPCASLLIHLSFSIGPSVYVSFALVLPLKTPDLTLKVPLVNHAWNLPHVWTLLLLSSELFLDLRGRVPLIIPVIGFSSTGAVIYMRWHSVQMHRPLQPFSGKQLTVLLSPLPLSLYLLFSHTAPLPLPLAIVFAQTGKIYCQKNEGCVKCEKQNCSVASDYLLVRYSISLRSSEKLFRDSNTDYFFNCVKFVKENKNQVCTSSLHWPQYAHTHE